MGRLRPRLGPMRLLLVAVPAPRALGTPAESHIPNRVGHAPLRLGPTRPPVGPAALCPGLPSRRPGPLARGERPGRPKRRRNHKIRSSAPRRPPPNHRTTARHSPAARTDPAKVFAAPPKIYGAQKSLEPGGEVLRKAQASYRGPSTTKRRRGWHLFPL